MRRSVLLLPTIWAAGLFSLVGCVDKKASIAAPDPAVQIREAHAIAKQAQTADAAGKKTEAVGLYQQAVSTYRNFPAAWNNLGVLLMEREENMAAVEAFRSAADQSPTDPRALTNIGIIWQRLGYLDKAAEAYTEALDRDESYLPALRESVFIDTTRGTINDRTARRVQRALLLEQDPAWAAELRRRKLVIDGELASVKDSLGR